MRHNFVRFCQTSKVTPMAAGVTAKHWEMANMMKGFEGWEASRVAAMETPLQKPERQREKPARKKQ